MKNNAQGGAHVKNSIPQDPIISKLVSIVRDAQVSRRNLLRGGAAVAAGAGAFALSSCATSGASGGAASAGEVTWANWVYYLDYDNDLGEYPSLEKFMDETGIAVNFLEDIDDNPTFIAKVRDQLELGKYTGYDLTTLSEYAYPRLIEQDFIMKIDKGNVENHTNMVSWLQNSFDSDPNRDYTMPWQVPVGGFTWHTENVPGGINTLEDLMQPELKGKIGWSSAMRFTIGNIMLLQGVDIGGAWGDKEFNSALDWLREGIDRGQFANFRGNSYVQDLATEALWVNTGYSGDTVFLNYDYGENWSFGVPESGGIATPDCLAILGGTSPEQKELAEELINYYYDPVVAAEVANHVYYTTPVEGAREAMESVNPENVDNQYIFPDEEMSSRLYSMRTLTPQEELKYEEAFATLLGK